MLTINKYYIITLEEFMFDKIQEITSRTLNGIEFNKLMRWVRDKEYSEEEIINAYKYCKSSDINYIQKYLESQKKQKQLSSRPPEWMNENIQDEPLDKKTLLKFIKSWKCFFDSEEEYKAWGMEQLKNNGYEIKEV